jgi:hypothetical protein
MLVFLAVVMLASCSGEEPVIYQHHWRLDVVAGPDGRDQFERLTLFVQADDADGFGDLSSITLSHRDQELVWELTPEQWQRMRISGENWVGSRSLMPPSGEPIPRGDYGLTVKDRAGERAEEEIFIDPRIRGLSRGPLGEELLPSPPGKGREPAEGSDRGIYYPFGEGQLLLLDEQKRTVRTVSRGEPLLSGQDGAGREENARDGNDREDNVREDTGREESGAGEPAEILRRLRSEGIQYFSITSYSPERGFGVERGPYPLERLELAGEP